MKLPQERWTAPPVFDCALPPRQASAREGHVDLAGTRIFYWDTGGAGEPIVLMHPATGSAHMWLYQQPVFANAGYRVIGWSRRGHRGSDPVDPAAPGSAVQDLVSLLDHLKIASAHLVASAAGGAISFDAALAYPDRVRSLVISSSVGGAQDADYLAASARIRPMGFDGWPSEFRELGPSYRAGDPDGVARWLALEHGAVTGHRLGQKVLCHVTFAALEALTMPVLLMTGDADLWMPPVFTRRYARHIPQAQLVIIPECGHALYWEAPALFNGEVLRFLGQKPGPLAP